MIVKNLYKYSGKNGTIYSLVDLGIPCTEMKRLVAEEGKELVNGEDRCVSIDVLPEEVEFWKEEDAIPEREVDSDV